MAMRKNVIKLLVFLRDNDIQYVTLLPVRDFPHKFIAMGTRAGKAGRGKAKRKCITLSTFRRAIKYVRLNPTTRSMYDVTTEAKTILHRLGV